VRRYARGRALDCFTASGGFALHCVAPAQPRRNISELLLFPPYERGSSTRSDR
jgi:hypothetical protein